MKVERTPSRFSHIFTRQEVQQFFALVCKCASVILQDLPDPTTQKDVRQYLADNKLQNQVLQFLLVTPHKLKLSFVSPQAAYRYYIDHNLTQSFDKKLVNIYLDINFDPKYINKFILIGVTESNQNKIFSVLKRYGIIKLKFINRVENEHTFMALLSIADARVFTTENYDSLKEGLKQYGITTKICRQPNLVPKVQVCLNNFLLEQRLYKKTQALIIVWNIIARLKLSFESAPFITIESKQNDTDWQVGCPRDKLRGKIICSTDSETKELYSKITSDRQLQCAGILILNKKENTNSFANLFTKYLKSPSNMSEYEFKNLLLREYRKVTPEVANLTLYRTAREGVFHGKLYFENEIAGRKFLAYYMQNSHNLKMFYTSPNKLTFQMYIDKQTLYQFKQYKKRQQKQVQRQTKENIIPPNQLALLGNPFSVINQLSCFPSSQSQKNPLASEKQSGNRIDEVINIQESINAYELK